MDRLRNPHDPGPAGQKTPQPAGFSASSPAQRARDTSRGPALLTDVGLTPSPARRATAPRSTSRAPTAARPAVNASRASHAPTANPARYGRVARRAASATSASDAAKTSAKPRCSVSRSRPTRAPQTHQAAHRTAARTHRSPLPRPRKPLPRSPKIRAASRLDRRAGQPSPDRRCTTHPDRLNPRRPPKQNTRHAIPTGRTAHPGAHVFQRSRRQAAAPTGHSPGLLQSAQRKQRRKRLAPRVLALGRPRRGGQRARGVQFA